MSEWREIEFNGGAGLPWMHNAPGDKWADEMCSEVLPRLITARVPAYAIARKTEPTFPINVGHPCG